MAKKILQVVVMIMNLSTFFIVVGLWSHIGAWALLYVLVWFILFYNLAEKFKLYELSDEAKLKKMEFTKDKTFLGRDYRYDIEYWKDNFTGEIFEW